jgi:ribosome-binding factor A
MDYRLERIGNLIQEKIGVLIVGGKIKDPRVNSFLSITRVSVSKDLVWADVYVSTFKNDTNLAQGVTGLQSAAGFIQANLAKEIHIRQTPRLRFHRDAGVREGFDLLQKIEEIANEGKKANESSGEGE